MFLFSPVLNQKKPPNLPTHPSVELQKLPIFIQIGAKENALPPSIHQSPAHDNPKYKDMQNKSRLKATEDWHQTLAQSRYNVESPLRIHPYGHDSVHVFEGLVEGMKFHQSQLLTLNATRSTDIGKTKHYKDKIKEVKQPQPGYMAPTQSSEAKKSFVCDKSRRI